MDEVKLTTKYKFDAKSKGIYVLYINGRPYIGKDSHIAQLTRIYNHLSSLRKGTHFNKQMQEDFNVYGEAFVTYSVLFLRDEISDEDLVILEKEYTNKYDSKNNGYNLQEGYDRSEDFKNKTSDRLSGENHHNAKITNNQFYEIVELFKEEKTNGEIAEIYGLHARYISLIRHKKRFKRLWEDIDFTPDKSNKLKNTRKVDFVTYCEIRKCLDSGLGNVKTEKQFNLPSGSVSRLRNGKLYKDYYKQYASL